MEGLVEGTQAIVTTPFYPSGFEAFPSKADWRVLRQSLAAVIACTAAVTRADTPASTTSQLFHNEDCTNFFAGEYDPVDPNGGAAVDARARFD
jgi:hypothetical protein